MKRTYAIQTDYSYCTGGGQSNRFLYVCMVITYSKGEDHPGKVANSACGPLNKENEFFPVPVRA